MNIEKLDDVNVTGRPDQIVTRYLYSVPGKKNRYMVETPYPGVEEKAAEYLLGRFFSENIIVHCEKVTGTLKEIFEYRSSLEGGYI